ncbi:hypothetical protein HPB47_010022 [Ixodes persulcatus]|uniref:Uncharacterized protein n=1 Tax=Ixodes persulcatus TaxID=34615 RepID=A0AC60P0H5_IXOPE|nr:hypothetical protein HPB47_010022 [Ixodes persulcatus]
MKCEPSTGAGPSRRQKADYEPRRRATETGEQRKQREAPDAAAKRARRRGVRDRGAEAAPSYTRGVSKSERRQRYSATRAAPITDVINLERESMYSSPTRSGARPANGARPVAGIMANTSLLLDSLLSEKNYNRQFRPGFGGPPTEILTDVLIRSFGPVSENEMMFSMDCYFRQTWYDRRLRFDGDIKLLSVSWQFLEKVAYSSKEVVFKWKGPKPVDISSDVTLSQYVFLNITVANLTTYGPAGEVRSSLMARFILSRRRGYFILQIYAPCSLIVGASWVAFWINRSDAAGRVSVGATTVLTLVTMGFGGRASLPRVDYATALDWFVIMCFTFVFTALVEYACVNYLERFLMHRQRQRLEKLAKQEEHQDLAKVVCQAFCLVLEVRGGHRGPVRAGAFSSALAASFALSIPGMPSWPTILIVFNRSSTGSLARTTENAGSEDIRLRLERAEEIEEERRRTRLIGGCLEQLQFRWRRRKKRPVYQPCNTAPEERMTPSEVSAEVDAWARIIFPLTFTVLKVLYWTLFLYFVDDEIPEDPPSQN